LIKIWNSSENEGDVMKTKFEEAMEQVMDLPTTAAPITTPVVIEPIEHDDGDLQRDYKYARENMYGIIEKGSSALDELVAVAQASEHPRAYEVVAQLVKTLTDANRNLLAIQKDVKELKTETTRGRDGPTNVTNALFVGNTAELQKMIKSRQPQNVETAEQDSETN
jgi:hypothetical protein